MKKAYQVLKKYWGYDTFRPLQADIIQAVLEYKDVLALMPTGGGKSLCFQIPALLQPGITLVISPLIALMQDQVNQLKQRQVTAEALYAGMESTTISNILKRCTTGNIKLLYLSPERLQTPTFLEYLKQMQVSLLAIDEAHCISQWGYDFRPSYLAIHFIKKHLPKVPIIAVTATATSEVREDIQHKLCMHQPLLFTKSFARANLAYMVRSTVNKAYDLLTILKEISGSAVVYVNTRVATERVAAWLVNHHIQADYYHAGLNHVTRKAKQKAWIQDTIRVIVATNAFGMGIDKPNVRLVVHMNIPTTLEAYYQEAGRAGRDTKQAHAIVLYDSVDLEEVLYQVQRSYVSVENIKKVYHQLGKYFQIAIGKQSNTTYDFDQIHFTSICKLSSSTVATAIKQLVKQELIAFEDQLSAPATLHIILNEQALCDLRATDTVINRWMQALLDLYGVELFEKPYPVSLQCIAEVLDIDLQTASTQLNKLENAGILVYQSGKPAYIRFLTKYYSMRCIPFEENHLTSHQALLLDKAKAVIHYITHRHRCRTQLLLEYFGEVSYHPCQSCDICLSKKTKLSKKVRNHYSPRIQQHLAKQPMLVNELIEQIDRGKAEILVKTLQHMLAKGTIQYNQAMELVCKNP